MKGAALLVAICFGFSAQASEGRVVNTFGAWKIIADDTSFLLSDTTQRLAAICGPKTRIYLAFIAVFDEAALTYDAERKASYFNFAAWTDSDAPRDFKFYSDESSPRLAQIHVSLNPEVTSPQQDFWNMMKAAKQRISFSTPKATIRLDATDLPTAVQRFETLCAPILPPPYNLTR